MGFGSVMRPANACARQIAFVPVIVTLTISITESATENAMGGKLVLNTAMNEPGATAPPIAREAASARPNTGQLRLRAAANRQQKSVRLMKCLDCSPELRLA